MKKFTSVCSLLVVTLGFSTAQATSFVFLPPQSPESPLTSTGGMTHDDVYSWEIGWSIPSGEEIVAASLDLYGLKDYRDDRRDMLFIHLLDEKVLGAANPSWSQNFGTYTSRVYRGDDTNPSSASPDSDRFNGKGVLLAAISGDAPASDPWPLDTVYSIDFATVGALDELVSYLTDGKFFVGIDPDCHWYTRDMKLNIETREASVPDGGATMVLLSLSLLGVTGWRRFGRR